MVPATALADGRAAFARAEWRDAHVACRGRCGRCAGAGGPRLLARSAYMLGRDDGTSLRWARAPGYGRRRLPAAVRCTWWIGHNHLFRGGQPCRGWFGVGERLSGHRQGCVERGYMLIPDVFARCPPVTGWRATRRLPGPAIGERFGDADLTWPGMAGHFESSWARSTGDAACRRASRRRGFRVLVAGGPGIVYCNTIDFCLDVAELRQVKEARSFPLVCRPAADARAPGLLPCPCRRDHAATR
jgi:hypothetical protein